MNRSTNYGFNEPGNDEYYDIAQQNENWETADTEIKAVETTAASNLASARSALESAISAASTSLQSQITELQSHVVTETGTDLNDYTTVGEYFFDTNHTPANIPAGVNGLLIVLIAGVASARKQIWMRVGTTGTNDHMVWMRQTSTSSESGWGDWVRILTEKDLVTQLLITGTTMSQLRLVTDNYDSSYIRAFDVSGYGQNWLIQSGGNMIVGGGEFPSNMYNDNLDDVADTGERLILGADSAVDLYTNGNAIADRYRWRFTAAGNILLPDGTANIRANGDIYMDTDNVTGLLSTILSGKQATISGAASTIASNNLTASRALIANGNGKVAVSSVTSTELGYLRGITSNVQTQLNTLNSSVTSLQTAVNGKQATITGAATSIVSSNLSTNRALISNGSGKVAASAVTSTELGYLDGVTSNVQTQINNAKVTVSKHNAAGITNTPISSAADTAAGSFTLSAGKWLVTVGAYWDDKDLGREGHRSVWVSDSSSASIGDANLLSSASTNAITSGYSTRQQFTTILSPTASTTYYIRVRQYTVGNNSVKCSTSYNVVKLSS